MSVRSRMTAIALVLPLASLGWTAAPVHLHAGHQEEHEASLVHRHETPHPLERAHHHDTPEVDDGSGGQVVWLEQIAIAVAVFQFAAPVSAPALVTAAPTPRPAWFPKAQDDPAPAHGPPRARPDFRGPPFPTCLI